MSAFSHWAELLRPLFPPHAEFDVQDKSGQLTFRWPPVHVVSIFIAPNALEDYRSAQDETRAKQFATKKIFDGIEVEIAKDVKSVLRRPSLISIATTALKPHIGDLRECPEGAAILHISLRDLSPDVVLSCDNLVDDIDHVCRAQTSVHLAEQQAGNRQFIRCTLADVLSGRAPARNGSEAVSVFSPFGLGVLDLAVAKLVRDLARQQGLETVIGSFVASSWTEES